jgi:hypothetical protein
VRLRFHIIFLVIASCALAQEAGPVKVKYACAQDDLRAAGMSCSDSDPCAIYLELSGVAGTGRRLSVAGNLHGASATLASVLLLSEDNGVTWQEPAARVTGAALDQVQLLDTSHGWAAGEVQVPLARDPFFLITADGGATWRRQPLTEDGGPGDMQRFWFDTPDHGEVIVDAGRTAQGGRYQLYESHTGGTNWSVVSKTAQLPRLRKMPAEAADYRIGTDNRSHSYVVEKRDGGAWGRVASFLVQVASCGSPPVVPEPPEVAPDEK